jgi:hypothetical protein
VAGEEISMQCEGMQEQILIQDSSQFSQAEEASKATKDSDLSSPLPLFYLHQLHFIIP